MADPDDLLVRAYSTIAGWLAHGHETRTQPLAQLVRDARTPVVYDANFICDVRARTPDEIESLLEAADSMYRGLGHRLYLWDPGMPLEFEARLQLEGYEADEQVILVLEGALAAQGPKLDLRKAQSDADWETIYALCRLDHEEEAEKGFHDPWDESVTRQLVTSKRVKAPDVQFFLARVDGVDCAFFSAWPGENGVGQVEDLFTRSDFRGRGIGTALIARCVDDARARGAHAVLIGARPNDTPKHMYAALGFRPLCVERRYLKTGFE
ncbi:MAG TPA: GNAT family N-acetyltransferase [Myxococcota bacterium]|nr:GNAT family N-acetyltransferase [Myxococcota bacterium]